jgi:hypothetical protein
MLPNLQLLAIDMLWGICKAAPGWLIAGAFMVSQLILLGLFYVIGYYSDRNGGKSDGNLDYGRPT